MNPLPLVRRELRVASRRKSAHRMRWLTALIGFMTLVSMLALSGGGGRSSGMGGPIFHLLVGLAALLCGMSGMFLTADCVSVEKREGTLGLLFLANLRPVDILLGKLAAHGLPAVYGLTALIPILGMPLLMGGVAGRAFVEVGIALVSLLFFSLVTGLSASVLSHGFREAWTRTLLGLLLFLLGFFFLERILKGFGWDSPWTTLVLGNGLSALFSAGGGGGEYGLNLGGTLAWSLTILWVAVVRFPLSWRQEGGGSQDPVAPVKGATVRPRAPRPAFSGTARPCLWLMERESQGWGRHWDKLLGAVVLLGLVVVCLSGLDPGVASALYWVVVGLGILVKMSLGLDACRFFQEARRTGSLELLLCTPLRDSEIENSHWLALWRRYRVALGLLTLMGVTLMMSAIMQAFQSAGPTAVFPLLGSVLYFGVFLLELILDGLALVWVARWLSLSLRRPHLAGAWTVCLVLVVPTLIVCLPDLIWDLALIGWSRRKLQDGVRPTLRRLRGDGLPLAV